MLLILYLTLFCKTTYVLSVTTLTIKKLSNIKLNEDEEIERVKSQIQCVLKCQRKSTNGFYTNKRKCFCTFGFVDNGDQLESGNHLTEVIEIILTFKADLQ